VGPNGAGKSTLLRAILREHPIDEGELRTGGSIDPAFYRQDLAQLPLEGTPFDLVLSDRPQWERGAVQGHLGRFGFSGDDVRRQVSSFSGGERSRLALALIMLRRANLLIFDEPTNHLDVETVEALEDAIEAYDGTIIVVSHDRELLRGVTNKVWSLRNARITVFDGSFAEWEEVAESSETVEVPTPQKSPAARQESSGAQELSSRRPSAGSRSWRRA
jgi:ATP-binding cassette, subfamily F, member 3